MIKLKKQLNKIYAPMALLLVPAWSSAADYVPLAGKIPGLNNTGDLVSYVNALYKVILMLGVVLSVLVIAYAGFEYMTIDVAMKKSGAKTRIRQALTGLLMLLATYLVLNQINPDIVKLDLLSK